VGPATLAPKGYARTTARDIAAAAGTSLAAIGYHYRSTEALLNAALIQAIEDWGQELERALAAEPDPGAAPLQRYEAIWTRVVESFATHRQLWAATFEAYAQLEHAPEIRQVLADGLAQARSGLASLFQNVDERAVDPQLARTVGSFYAALLSGVLVQWLIDPERAPSGRDLADALRTVAATVAADGPGRSGPVGEAGA
jgi:AcrR family transcriptional regulator